MAGIDAELDLLEARDIKSLSVQERERLSALKGVRSSSRAQSGASKLLGLLKRKKTSALQEPEIDPEDEFEEAEREAQQLDLEAHQMAVVAAKKKAQMEKAAAQRRQQETVAELAVRVESLESALQRVEIERDDFRRKYKESKRKLKALRGADPSAGAAGASGAFPSPPPIAGEDAEQLVADTMAQADAQVAAAQQQVTSSQAELQQLKNSLKEYEVYSDAVAKQNEALQLQVAELQQRPRASVGGASPAELAKLTKQVAFLKQTAATNQELYRSHADELRAARAEVTYLRAHQYSMVMHVSDAPLKIAGFSAAKLREIQDEDLATDEIGTVKTAKTSIGEQKLAFMAWVNRLLVRRGLEVENLDEHLSDGHVFAYLVQELSGSRMTKALHPIGKCGMKIFRLENCKLVLDFLREQQHVRLVNIGAEDIEGGHVKAVLGLLWTLVLKYQSYTVAKEEELQDDETQLKRWVKDQIHAFEERPWVERDFKIEFQISQLDDAPEPSVYRASPAYKQTLADSPNLADAFQAGGSPAAAAAAGSAPPPSMPPPPTPATGSAPPPRPANPPPTPVAARSPRAAPYTATPTPSDSSRTFQQAQGPHVVVGRSGEFRSAMALRQAREHAKLNARQ